MPPASGPAADAPIGSTDVLIRFERAGKTYPDGTRAVADGTPNRTCTLETAPDAPRNTEDQP